MNSPCLTKPSRPVSLQPDRANPDRAEGAVMTGYWLPASEIAQAVASRRISALSVTEAALARIARHDPVLNSFTDVVADRARAKAPAIDATLAAGKHAGALAGVPL